MLRCTWSKVDRRTVVQTRLGTEVPIGKSYGKIELLDYNHRPFIGRGDLTTR
jgi:hypothetical protein